MKKRLTFDQRMDLAIKLWHCFAAFMLLGLILGWVVAFMEEKVVLLILVVICVAIGSVFASISLWVRYHESKPKWQQDVEQKWLQDEERSVRE